MEKIQFDSLGLKFEAPTVELVDFPGVLVRRRVTAQEKLNLAADTYDILSSDETRIFNKLKFNIIYYVELVKLYTNIEFDENSTENYGDIYDKLSCSGLLDAVIEEIVDNGMLYALVFTVVESIYNYDNSAYGVMEGITKNYDATKFDFESLNETIKDPDAIPLVKEVLDKLG